MLVVICYEQSEYHKLKEHAIFSNQWEHLCDMLTVLTEISFQTIAKFAKNALATR